MQKKCRRGRAGYPECSGCECSGYQCCERRSSGRSVTSLEPEVRRLEAGGSAQKGGTEATKRRPVAYEPFHRTHGVSPLLATEYEFHPCASSSLAVPQLTPGGPAFAKLHSCPPTPGARCSGSGNKLCCSPCCPA